MRYAFLLLAFVGISGCKSCPKCQIEKYYNWYYPNIMSTGSAAVKGILPNQNRNNPEIDATNEIITSIILHNPEPDDISEILLYVEKYKKHIEDSIYAVQNDDFLVTELGVLKGYELYEAYFQRNSLLHEKEDLNQNVGEGYSELIDYNISKDGLFYLHSGGGFYDTNKVGNAYAYSFYDNIYLTLSLNPNSYLYKRSISALWFLLCRDLLKQNGLNIHDYGEMNVKSGSNRARYQTENGEWEFEEIPKLEEIFISCKGCERILDPKLYRSLVKEGDGQAYKAFFELILWSTFRPKSDKMITHNLNGGTGVITFTSDVNQKKYKVKFDLDYPFCFKIKAL